MNTMAPPPLSEGVNHGQVESNVGDEITQLMNLTEMSPEQRQEVYKQKFAKVTEPLEYMNTPAECETYPDLANEIWEAYTRLTTVIVKVWVNYDALVGKFYVDGRQQDCGKLVLGHFGRKKLKLFKECHLELRRVRLELGTPFNTLFEITLKAVPSKLGLDGRIDILRTTDLSDARRPHLLEHVEGVLDGIQECSLAHGQKGMLLKDVEEIAAMFKRQPTHAELWQRQRYSNVGPWMDLYDETESNDGWVDLEALEKERASGGSEPKRSRWWP